MRNYVAIDVGGSSVKHALINENGEIIKRGSIKTIGNDIDKFIESIGKFVDEYKKQNKIEGLACSFPGAVDVQTGFIGGASAVECIHGPNIEELLEDRCGVRVTLENDANCAALAEGWIGAAKDVANFICIVCGTGIGGAIVINNSIVKGRHLHGGEFGFMFTKNSDGYLDNTWSEIASTNSLVHRVAKVKEIDKENLNGLKVFKLAEEGDKQVAGEIDKWYMDLARGIFNLQYILDPDKIIIGGGISSRPDFDKKINEKLVLLKGRYATLDIKVEKCKFKNDSNLIGALYNFLNTSNQYE